MVNDLSKIAQKSTAPGGGVDTAEMKLKVLGLECLVTIMKSLVDWSKDLRLNYEETSMYCAVLTAVVTVMYVCLFFLPLFFFPSQTR